MVVKPTYSESIPPLRAPAAPVIGFVGGVGSGKSTLARWVASQLDAGLIDADAVGHQVLQNEQVRDRIREEFGDSVFDNTGHIDRSALSLLVFGDAEPHSDARRRLEMIVHPEIHRTIETQISTLRSNSNGPCILLDAAVLFEAGWQDRCDFVIFVDTPVSVRQQRAAGRGWSAETHRKREASQLPLEQKRKMADFSVSNVDDITAAGNAVIDTLVTNGLIKARCESA